MKMPRNANDREKIVTRLGLVGTETPRKWGMNHHLRQFGL